jgi:multidrug efflux pump subunit AcrB
MTTSQFFVYKRPIAWTLLVSTLIWGVFAYISMPQRQDPVIQVRSGVIQTEYAGASAAEVELEVTRKIEKKMSENPAVEHVRSISRQGLSVVFVDLYDTSKNAEAIWQDLDNKLASMTDLPSVGMTTLKPKLDKDFGDTVAVMLTISSPPVSDFEVERRAQVIGQKIDALRADRPALLRDRRYSGVLVHPSSVSPEMVERIGRSLLTYLSDLRLIEDPQYAGMLGAGIVDFRLANGHNESELGPCFERFKAENVGAGLGHPDIWPGVFVQKTSDLAHELKARCQEEPGGVARYSYEELRQFADILQDRLRQSPRVGKIEQIGVVSENIYLYYSNRRLGALGLDPNILSAQLAYRNINLPGGTVELPRQNLVVKPSGKFLKDNEIGEQAVETRGGYPAYVRDLVEIVRGYEDPPRLLNFRTVKTSGTTDPALSGFERDQTAESGHGTAPDRALGPEKVWTTRALTLAVRHVKGTQIAAFSKDVDACLASMQGVLPPDLRIERTSNEPALVAHKIDQFVDCLIEAVLIVVVIALLFMEWRSAVIVAISIPITVAMTLGFCAILGVDLQQISIAALIIALGLLVDDPVVACDAINREIAHGAPRDVAAWLGPQKLSRAILYATITNCVAFLPLLLVTGAVGEFIYTLPVVVTASLVASRLVSMTFIPLLGQYLLRGQTGLEAGLEDGGRGSRFARMYNGFSEFFMGHKWASMASCLVVLAGAFSLIPLIGTSFFPKDLHNVLTINLFLSEGTPIRQTKAEAMKAIELVESLIGPEVQAYTTFIGAGGPRFWLSIVPEQPAANYAQVLVHTREARHTEALAVRLKRELPALVPAARVVVQQIETGPPVGVPVQVRLQGRDLATIRRLGEQIKGFMRSFPGTIEIQDDWDPEYLQLALQVDPDRAKLSGVTHQDVASAMSGGLSGSVTTTIRERDRLIPVTLRLRPDERSRLEDIMTLDTFSATGGGQRVSLDQVGAFRTELVSPKIARRDNERCLTVKCDTVAGVLPSRLVEYLNERLKQASKDWPPGYHFAFGGEKEEQSKGFSSMAVAMVASILAIYIALVIQFNSLAKPLIVFAAVPFGMVGGLMGLLIFDVPLGFFALLGLSSLAGVIISHVIVLFEYIEEAHERGEPLRRAVIDAALVRLRPVLVTVLATVGGLIPLAIKGGPLWEPLCYVQIAGLLVATLVTKVVVPVLYVIFVEDLKLIRWAEPGEHVEDGPPAEYRLDKARANGHARHAAGASQLVLVESR